MDLVLLLPFNQLGVLIKISWLLSDIITLVHTAVDRTDEVVFAFLLLNTIVSLVRPITTMGASCCLEQTFMVCPKEVSVALMHNIHKELTARLTT